MNDIIEKEASSIQISSINNTKIPCASLTMQSESTLSCDTTNNLKQTPNPTEEFLFKKGYTALAETGQQILNNINKKRTRDEVVHPEFRTCLNSWSNEITNKVVDKMYDNYECYSKSITTKFSIIKSDLDRIQKLENEIKYYSDIVEKLYKQIIE